VKNEGLRIIGIDFKAPARRAKLAKLRGERLQQRGTKLVPEIGFNISRESIDKLVCRLAAQVGLLRVAVAGVSEVGPVDRQIDIFGEAADRIEGF
jgi:hypothetical protein